MELYDGLNGENATQGMEIPHARSNDSDANEIEVTKTPPLNNEVEQRIETKCDVLK